MNTILRCFFIILTISIPLMLHSCKQKGQNLPLPMETVNQTDTIIHGDLYVPCGQDSIVCILKDNGWRKVIYTTTILDGNIHYKIFDTAENLREIAYIRYIPLAFDSTNYDTVMFPHPDSVVQYNNNGVICKTGLVEYEANNYLYTISPSWTKDCSYDSTGILTQMIIFTAPGSFHFVSESYYRNGQIKEKWIQGESFASGACLGTTEWDSLGNKIKEREYDYKMQKKNWTSYNERFCVETTTEYYPNGRIKQVTKTKSFVESEECPCGQWIYYDEKGQKVRTEQHKPCNNFLIDCGNE